MVYKYYPRNFKQFYPLTRLNQSVSRLDIFNRELSKPHEMSFRYKRFAACDESLHRNTIRFRHLLNSISEHFNVSYDSKERKKNREFKLMKNKFALENDLLLFFAVLKIFLDDMAFFVPFYFKEPIKVSAKNPDMRDMKRPKDFRSLKHYFYENEDIDKGFVSILKANDEWTNELCDIRKFLIHHFHDLSVGNDWWTQSYYGLLYEFNEIKGFIPDILFYVAKIYYRFVRFTKDFEEHFKNRCQIQFSEFEYSESGCVSSGLNKTHFYFAGLGRLLKNSILIRIHPCQRNKIPKTLEYFMQEEKIVCSVCDSYQVNIKPTIENFVIISANCDCGKSFRIPPNVERKFYPFFMDQNQRHIIDRLISFETKIAILKYSANRKSGTDKKTETEETPQAEPGESKDCL